MLLWNWLLPGIFGLVTIGYFKALGLYFLARFLLTRMTKVCLVSVTPDAEKTIGYIARVSNPANQDNPKVAGLLKYCIKHGHWSVFEQATMTLEILLLEVWQLKFCVTVHSASKSFPNAMLIPPYSVRRSRSQNSVFKTTRIGRILSMLLTRLEETEV